MRESILQSTLDVLSFLKTIWVSLLVIFISRSASDLSNSPDTLAGIHVLNARETRGIKDRPILLLN